MNTATLTAAEQRTDTSGNDAFGGLWQQIALLLLQ